MNYVAGYTERAEQAHSVVARYEGVAGNPLERNLEDALARWEARAEQLYAERAAYIAAGGTRSYLRDEIRTAVRNRDRIMRVLYG